MTEQTIAPSWPALSLAEVNARLTAPGSPFAVTEIAIRGVPTRIWANAPLTLRDIFVTGRAHGEKTFLVYEDERASFEAFGRATLALAENLIRGGVRPGDRVAIAMRNLPEWPVAFFAALLAGAIATPLNAWWTGPSSITASPIPAPASPSSTRSAGPGSVSAATAIRP